MIIGMLLLGLGLWLFYLIVRGKAAIKNIAVIIAAYFTLSGGLIMAAFMFRIISLAWFLVLSCSGGMCILVGCYHYWRKMFSCKEETEALYIDTNSYSGNATVTRCSPIFQYEFQGQKYVGQSVETFSEKQIERKFQTGKKYSIYIDEKQPHVFVISRRMQWIDVFLIAMGLLFVCAGIGIIEGWPTV